MPQCAMCADESRDTPACTYRNDRPLCVEHALEWDEYHPDNNDPWLDSELMQSWDGSF